MAGSDYCNICNLPKDVHQHRERQGMLHHAFNGMGNQLSPSRLSPVASPPSDSAQQPAIEPQGLIGKLPTGDPIIRALLIRKGLITLDELKGIEDELTRGVIVFSGPDRSDSSTWSNESTTRSLRDPFLGNCG